jgi:hypothetical protein
LTLLKALDFHTSSANPVEGAQMLVPSSAHGQVSLASRSLFQGDIFTQQLAWPEFQTGRIL